MRRRLKQKNRGTAAHTLPVWSGRRGFVFSAAKATLTPKMRLTSTTVPTGITTAPIVQGSWAGTGTPDTLVFGRGSQVVGNWYDLLDPNQGSIEFFWKPEKSTAGTFAECYAFYFDFVRLWYWHGSSTWRAVVGTQAFNISGTVTAGTNYAIALGWNCLNKIDGTNYARFTIGDSHTYGITTQPTVAAPPATMNIGSGGANYAADAIISGLTIRRRVPFDGTYGTAEDGSTDELAAMYAAGAGVRPAQITSADLVAEFPGSGTAGELATGTGHMWSFPWASNELANWHLQADTGGAADSWTAVNAPTLANAATADILMGTRAQKISVDAADEGIRGDTTPTAGDDKVVFAWLKGQGTGKNVQLRAYDADGAAAIVTVANEVLERVTNGGFDADTDWTKGDGWSVAAGVASCDGSQTGNSAIQQAFADQSNGGIVKSTVYKFTYTLSNYSAGQVRIYTSGGDIGTWRSANGTYTELLNCGNTTIYVQGDVDFVGDIDDVSVTPADWQLLNTCYEVPAGCSNVQHFIESTDADTYDIHAQYFSVLPNLVVNGGFEGTYDDESGGGGGTVNVAPGWNASAVETDGTDTLDESATAHSGAKSQQINVNAANEGIITASNVFTTNKWYLVTVWLYGTSGSVLIFDSVAAFLNKIVTPPAGSWTKYSFVVKATSNRALGIWSSGGAANFLVDDVSVIALSDVSITATAASAANSVEGTGLRVDGLDTLTQTIPVGALSATSGSVEFKWTPRHSNGVFESFGVSNPLIFDIYKNTNNRIYAYHQTDTNFVFDISVGGVSTSSGAQNFTTTITAGTEYDVKIVYSPSSCEFYINNTLEHKLEPAAGINFGANKPDIIYLGSNFNGVGQSDAVFS